MASAGAQGEYEKAGEKPTAMEITQNAAIIQQVSKTRAEMARRSKRKSSGADENKEQDKEIDMVRCTCRGSPHASAQAPERLLTRYLPFCRSSTP